MSDKKPCTFEPKKVEFSFSEVQRNAKHGTPPRSAPSVIPKRPRLTKTVRVLSVPVLINGKGSGDSRSVNNQSSDESEIESSVYSRHSSKRCSDLDISCSHLVNNESSITTVATRSVGTNYSRNDCSKSIFLLKSLGSDNKYEKIILDSFSIQLKLLLSSTRNQEELVE